MDYSKNYFLAQQLQKGDAKAYDFLMNSFYKKLCAYAQSLTLDRANAEDIVQNVFVKIWIQRKMINPHLSIQSFLYKAVYNGFIDNYRKNKPVLLLEKKYMEAIDLLNETEHENLEELIRCLNAEIEKLPKKCKHIFLLNKKEGLTHIEISEYLNISIKTVEGHITKAFKILEEKLGDQMQSWLFLFFNFKKNAI